MNKFEKQLEKWNNGILRGAQAKLAKTLHVSTATTALWTTGKRRPSKGYIGQMAALFGLDMYDVLKLFEPAGSVTYPTPDTHLRPHALRERMDSIIYPMPDAQNLLQQNTVRLPFLSAVPAHYPQYPEDTILEWWSIPRRYAQGAKYLVRSKDIALPDALSEDDLCWIKPSPEPVHGQMMLLTDGSGAFCAARAVQRRKTYYYVTDTKRKTSLDDTWQPIGLIVRRIKPL